MRKATTRVIGAAAALMASMPVMTGLAEAKMKDMSFHVVQNEFSSAPTLEMEFKGGKWTWANKGENFNIQVKIKLRAIANKFRGGMIAVPDTGMQIWQMASGYATNNLETLVPMTIHKAYLAPLQGRAAMLCDVFGGEKKAVRDMPLPAVLSVSQGGDVSRKNGTFPVKVVCMAKPEPQRAPVDFKVSDVKLYTVPARPMCGRPVNLVAEFHANKAGKVDFQLHRRDGNMQQASVNIGKTGKGYAKRWSKTYNFSKSSSHEYMVVVKGHPFSVGWVPVTVSCSAKTDQDRPSDMAN